jgi:hypothetical protein
MPTSFKPSDALLRSERERSERRLLMDMAEAIALHEAQELGLSDTEARARARLALARKERDDQEHQERLSRAAEKARKRFQQMADEREAAVFGIPVEHLPEYRAEQARRAEALRRQQELERLLGMAGWLYVLDAGHGLLKIGKTVRDPDARAAEWKLPLLYSCRTANCHEAERLAHEALALHRVGTYELFGVSLTVARLVVDDACRIR